MCVIANGVHLVFLRIVGGNDIGRLFGLSLEIVQRLTL
jgi:hypothetical protein